MFSLFNFIFIFPWGSADPICPCVRTPTDKCIGATAAEKLQGPRVGTIRDAILINIRSKADMNKYVASIAPFSTSACLIALIALKI